MTYFDPTLLLGWGAIILILGIIIAYLCLSGPKDVGKGYDDPDDDDFDKMAW